MDQIGLQSAGAPSCPEASKVATVKIKRPLLANPLEGAAYLAAQNANPFGSFVALYLYAVDPISGVAAKAAGEVLEDPVTGQLTAHFEKNSLFANDPRFAGEQEAQFLPEVPFEDVELHFFGGDRAPLGTLAACGSYVTTGTFTPWSGGDTTRSTSEFQITSGPHGSACTSPLPFDPSLHAGTSSIQAGGFSPFITTFSRDDGNQNLHSLTLHMPPGLLGTLASVRLCGEPQADSGTCGAESLIGHTTVSVGLGGDPYSVTGGQVFITGPYKGAPFGLSIVNPAKAGPFDLGLVVVRAKIDVDRGTSALTITTDDSGPYKIPSILDGIPLQIRHVNVNIDRPGFTFNPTNCNPLAISGTLNSDHGGIEGPVGAATGDELCDVGVQAKADREDFREDQPREWCEPRGEAGLPRGTVRREHQQGQGRPSQAASVQAHHVAEGLYGGSVRSHPAGCPAASLIGHAKAITPVIPVLLEGPAYFVSHGGEAFPSLIIVLQGYGVTVDLVGSTFISKAGITSSTFKTVPDVPVGSFELTLPQGKFSALAANGNLCKSKLVMPTAFLGQNGAQIHTSTPITAGGCAKTKKKHKGKATHRVVAKHSHASKH